MKRVLGLDLGTNSIGWALVEIDHTIKIVRIVALGSRILPMDAREIGDFENTGKIKSSAAQRTEFRGPRRLNERFLLRRDRLHLVLNLLNALPEHYALMIDFEKNDKRCGQFKEDKEPKIAYKEANNSKFEFYYEDAFNEMIEDLQKVNPNIKNEKKKRVPRDWTLYYLRKKALTKKISLEELAWVLLSYNQKRGYEKLEVEDKNEKENEIKEFLELKVESVLKKEDNKGIYYEIQLSGLDKFTYKEYTQIQLTKEGDIKELIKTTVLDTESNIDPKKTKYTITDIYTLTIEDTIHKKTDNKKTPHQYTIKFNNGWENVLKKKKYTSQYANIKGQSFDYIVSTEFDTNKTVEVKKRTFREPNYSDKSNDWTLLKKKTEKEAIEFNIQNGYVENKTSSAKKYISPKIYEVLKNDAKTGNRTKIIGGMFQVVERAFYREELNDIITTQRKYHQSLEDKKIFEDCVKLLYPNNKKHANALLKNKKAIQHLLVEDILLYQRDLKSKKSEISDCKYEIRHWEENKDGNIPHYHKVVPISHPLFQEFRIWDKIHNLKLIQIEKNSEKGKETNVDVTQEYFKNEEDYKALFGMFNNQKSVNQKQFLKFCSQRFSINENNFLWNYPEEEELKGNETRVSFAFRFKRCGFIGYKDFLVQEKEISLWHYLYSVNYKERNKNDRASINNFFKKLFHDYKIDKDILDKIINDFSNYPQFDSKYGAFSEKALKKLLPFIRLSGNRFKGKFALSEDIKRHLIAIKYDSGNITEYLNLNKASHQKRTKEERKEIEGLKQNIYKALWQDSINKRLDKIKNYLKKIDFEQEVINFNNFVKTEVNEQKGELAFPKGLFNAFSSFKDRDDEEFTGLNLTQASYLVYGRHSELSKAKFWKSPNEIREEINKELKQHSLNNPVAERVLREMMQVVADIWEYYGKGQEKFFSKIHLEVGRNLKNSAKEKENYYKNQQGNKVQNERLRSLLAEHLANSIYNAIPNNSDHFERLKIVENSIQSQIYRKDYYNGKPFKKNDIDTILKETKITKKQFEKYKLWVEQSYQSPYTGKFIKLSELFNGNKYNIDHIFPRASVTNNSINNKVVCERIINKLKGDLTGREFILKYGGQENLTTEDGTIVEHKIIDDDSYVNLVKRNFSKNKQFVLLAKEIPSGFTNSQLNNARHIARKAMELLSHIVREPGEVEFRSKNVLPVTGSITAELKRVWGLNEVWVELMSPRFKRLNKLTKSHLFGNKQKSKSGHEYFDCNLDRSIRENNPSYNIKRLDHRHHALDALIIALCTEEHVKYINNINSGINPNKKNSKRKIKQIKKQREKLRQTIKYSVSKEERSNEKNWIYLPPGSYHNSEIKGYGKESVVETNFEYKGKKDLYKKIVLKALKETVTTFKREKAPIRKTPNSYYSFYDEYGKLRIDKHGNPIKTKTKQIDKNSKKYKSTNKRNIAIRKEMHDEQPYGQIKLDFEILEISKNLKKRHLIFDEEIRTRIEDIIVNSDNNLVEAQKELSKNPITDNYGNEITHIAYELNKKKFYYKIRKALSSISNEKHIRKIADKNLQEELKNHVKKYDGDYEQAFSTLGIKQFNENRKVAVQKVTFFESSEKRYILGKTLLKKKNKKFVEGRNNYFVINRIENKYYTISLKEVIDSYNEGININEEIKNETKDKFYLSPGELVYIPSNEQLSNINDLSIDMLDYNRIYKFVNSTGTTANFIPANIANVIFDYDKKKNNEKKMMKIIENLSGNCMKIPSAKNAKKLVYLENEIGMASRQNKNTVDIIDYKSIKERCWKLKVNRIGQILDIIK